VARAADVLRIANCSGYFGDRLSAAAEMVEGGPIDVLTGDWLAELTMLILAGQRASRPDAGYAGTFVTQMEQVLGPCLDRDIKVVSNAGGLNPAGCARAVAAVADRLGLRPRIAWIEGDDLLGRLDALQAGGEALRNLDTGEPFDVVGAPVSANAYIGGFGISEALAAGADVVICGRITDAALVVGPAAWHFGWKEGDLDALAGAVVAGHVIECGPQAVGGNYAFFREVPGLEHPGFPIAEVRADGSSTITKHPGAGGLVSIGTVTAQLLYEIAGPAYPNPDVTARFDTIELAQDGPDRVAITGVRGEPPPATAKVAVNYQGGFRNQMSVVFTGLDIEAKAELFERTLWSSLPGGRGAVEHADVQLLRHDRPDAPTNEGATAELRVTVTDAVEARVGRAFSRVVADKALSTYPGFFATSPPGDARPYGVYWPTTVAGTAVEQQVFVDGAHVATVGWSALAGTAPASVASTPTLTPTAAEASGPTTPAPLGRILGARSGDKGGNANLGVWARTPSAYPWLRRWLTSDQLRAVIPEAAPLEIDRHELPNLLAVNFVIKGLLGRGVAATSRIDPQAKGLGEYFRSRYADLPSALLDEAGDKDVDGNAHPKR
jgi:hypothetical protein